MMEDRNERTELLLGGALMRQLREAHVLVAGLGGVGGAAAEMICRAGVGRMTLVDADTVSVTNLNRQLIALHSTVGQPKTEVLGQRLKDIAPDLQLTLLPVYLKDEKIDEVLDLAAYDFVVDAIDTLSPKVSFIKGALDRDYPLVSSMGAGAKTDPELVEITDISKSHHCPLAFMLRKRLHKLGIRKGFTAVFSPEPVREGSMIRVEEQNKKSNVGTISYMPVVFGCHCASVVLRGLIGENF